MKLLIILLASLTLLTGCGFNDEIVSQKLKTYEVIDVKRPKYFKVSLRDVETNQVFERLRVSKRCSNWRNLKLGSRWQFTEVVKMKEDGSKYSQINDVHTLCGRL